MFEGEMIFSWIAKGGILLTAIAGYLRVMHYMHNKVDKKEEDIRKDERWKTRLECRLDQLEKDN